MSVLTKQYCLSSKLCNLLSIISEESKCGCSNKKDRAHVTYDSKQDIREKEALSEEVIDKQDGKRLADTLPNTANKKIKQHDCSEHEMPPFYYNLQRRKFKGMDIPKLVFHP